MSKAITEARKKANLNQSEFARLFEIPLRTVQNWEANKSNCPAWAEKLIIKELKLLEEK